MTGERDMQHQHVGQFPSRGEAEVARGMLSEHGIEARLVVDDVAGLHPELSLATGGVTLEVDEADADEARELLEDVIPASPPSVRPRLRRRVIAVLLFAVALILAVAIVTAIAEVGLHWL